MAEILTAEMAQTIHWSPALADESAWNALDAIASGAHVVIPVEELARLREVVAELDSGLSSTVAECDRLAGINRDLLAAAQPALHEMRHTTAPRNSFTDAIDLLDAAIAATTRAIGPADKR